MAEIMEEKNKEEEVETFVICQFLININILKTN